MINNMIKALYDITVCYIFVERDHKEGHPSGVGGPGGGDDDGEVNQQPSCDSCGCPGCPPGRR